MKKFYVYGTWEVEHHDFPVMDYFITHKMLEDKCFYLCGVYDTLADARAKVKELM